MNERGGELILSILCIDVKFLGDSAGSGAAL
jgi:hypothetical protein